MKKKIVIILLALVLVIGGLIGGTVALLLDRTDSVVNTFTTSNISIELSESKNLNLKMVPGHTLTKDPEVTVKANSEPCYLFVKLDESTDFDEFLDYTIAGGWTELADTDGVWYRVVNTSTSDQSFDVLADNKVIVLSTVTKDMMAQTPPTLTVTAYASQLKSSNSANFEPLVAWQNVASLPAPTPAP